MKTNNKILKVARVQEGLTMEETSKALGIHRNTLTKYEKGDYSSMTLAVLKRYVDLLGVDVKEVYDNMTLSEEE